MVAVGDPPTTERVMLLAENLAALLRGGGIDGRDAAWACDILPLILTASAVEVDVYRTRLDNQEEFVANLRQVFSALPAERFPNIKALERHWTAGEGNDRFVFAVDVFLDGLVARAARR